MIDWVLPLKTVTPNIQEHWSKKHKRNKQHEYHIRLKWLQEKPDIKLPCMITLTRLSPRELDYDNMVYSLKHVKDSIADLLRPGLAPGRADGSKDIYWDYNQSKSKTAGVRIQIDPFPNDPIAY